MVIVEFLGNILTSVLIGYLAFTNSLAERIESFLPETRTEEVAPDTIADETPEEEAPETLSAVRTPSRGVIPKILLEHAGFQRAAVIASEREEEFTGEPSGATPEETIEKALVNIYCQYKTDKYIRTTTGTGFFINQKGVIITNAHVAQFLLLEDSEDVIHDVDCVIRTGNPAVAQYEAELLYISPTWIFENANLITEETPIGTGERDYALLYISKSLDNTPLPTRFPVIPIDTALLSRSMEQSSVFTAGYPAEALLRNGADAELAPVVAETTIGSLYTFGSNYADLFSISDSPVGEQGASGGPIVTPDDTDVIGLIVTKGDAVTEGEHSLRAITLSYVDRTIIEETGFSLAQNMQGDVAYRGNIFKMAMTPFLAGILEEELAGTTEE